MAKETKIRRVKAKESGKMPAAKDSKKPEMSKYEVKLAGIKPNRFLARVKISSLANPKRNVENDCCGVNIFDNICNFCGSFGWTFHFYV